MKHRAHWFALSFAAVMLVLAFSAEASAYIDPATGSYVLQMLIAGLVGAGFAVGVFWKGIVQFFADRFSKKKRRTGEDDDD